MDGGNADKDPFPVWPLPTAHRKPSLSQQETIRRGSVKTASSRLVLSMSDGAVNSSTVGLYSQGSESTQHADCQRPPLRRAVARWGGTRSVPGVSGTPHFRYGGSRMRTDSIPILRAGFFQIPGIAVTPPGLFKPVWRYPFQSSPARPPQSSHAAKCPASCRCAAGVGVPAVH